MQLKLEVRGNTIGVIMDGLKAAERRLKTEIVLSVGDNTGTQEYIKPFEITEGCLDHPFIFSIKNKKK